MKVLLSGEFIDYQIEMARSLNSQGVETMVILLTDEFLDDVEDLYSDINYRFLMRPRNVLRSSSLANLRRLKNEISKFNPDILHMQLGGTLLDFFLQITLGKYPLVTTFHDVELHIGEKSASREAVRFYLRSLSKKIIVHGENLKEQMCKVYGINPVRVHNVHMGEHEVKPFWKYNRKDIVSEGNSILFFGRIQDYKGLDVLFKSQPTVNDEIPEAKFIIAGGGQNISLYSQYISNPDRFEIHNYRIPYEQGAELFQRSSLVVLPYKEASQSGVVPTAYSYRKPVIATSVGSIPEVVDDGVTGILVRPGDHDELANAIIRLLKDRHLIQSLGDNAYLKLKKDFAWDAIARKTIDIYEDVIIRTPG